VSGYVTTAAFASVFVLLPIFSNLREATMSILWSESYFSTIVALGLMRREIFWDYVHRMQCLVQTMGGNEKALSVCTAWYVLQDGPKWARVMRRNVIWSSGALLCVATMIIVSMWLRVLVTGRPLCPTWPLYAYPWAVRLEMILTGVFIMVPVCTVGFLVAALSFLSCSAAGLHHALAHQLHERARERGAPGDAMDVIRMHQRVRGLTLEFTEFFAGSMVQLMAGPIGNSLLATLQVLANDIDENTFSQIFVVIVTLLQVSYLSQELIDSSLALKQAAYTTAASARSPREARDLVMLIMVTARPPALSTKGLGRLSLPMAGKVIREFYSAVNVLGPRYSSA
ncbi:Odorant receptor 67c, partial [Frankliniella fusca]